MLSFVGKSERNVLRFDITVWFYGYVNFNVESFRSTVRLFFSFLLRLFNSLVSRSIHCFAIRLGVRIFGGLRRFNGFRRRRGGLAGWVLWPEFDYFVDGDRSLVFVSGANDLFFGFNDFTVFNL